MKEKCNFYFFQFIKVELPDLNEKKVEDMTPDEIRAKVSNNYVYCSL